VRGIKVAVIGCGLFVCGLWVVGLSGCRLVGCGLFGSVPHGGVSVPPGGNRCGCGLSVPHGGTGCRLGCGLSVVGWGFLVPLRPRADRCWFRICAPLGVADRCRLTWWYWNMA